jgi:hypothetical protein
MQQFGKKVLLSSPVWTQWFFDSLIYLLMAVELVDKIPVYIWRALTIDISPVKTRSNLLQTAFVLR